MKKFLVRSEEVSLSEYGKYPGARSAEEMLKNGIIILDKPSGPTSHQVDVWVKEILGIKKASHGGTLDPRVTGIMVIALENATKLMPVLLSSKKEYVALINLHKEVEEDKIKKALQKFKGKIKQLPPKRSAVARRIREREIYYLEVLEIDKRNILIKVGCEAGTYIRRLADDIGKELKVGAHLQELRRTRSGNFTEEQVVTMQEVSDAVAEGRTRDVVLPMEKVVDGIGNVVIKDSAVDAICNGAPLGSNGISKIKEGIEKGEWVGMLSLKGELVAIGRAMMTSKEMKRKKGTAVKTDRVLMKKGTYPKMW